MFCTFCRAFWSYYKCLRVITGVSLLQVLPCNNIPQLTAVAAFENGQYVSAGGLAGLFLECDADGFKASIT